MYLEVISQQYWPKNRENTSLNKDQYTRQTIIILQEDI
jgi:hypothetical protein